VGKTVAEVAMLQWRAWCREMAEQAEVVGVVPEDKLEVVDASSGRRSRGAREGARPMAAGPRAGINGFASSSGGGALVPAKVKVQREDDIMMDQLAAALAGFANNVRSPLVTLVTFGRILMTRLPSGDVNRDLARNMMVQVEHLQELLVPLSHQHPYLQHPSLPSTSGGFAGPAPRIALAAPPLADEEAREESAATGGEVLLEGDDAARQLVDVEAEEDFGDAIGDVDDALYAGDIFEMDSEYLMSEVLLSDEEITMQELELDLPEVKCVEKDSQNVSYIDVHGIALVVGTCASQQSKREEQPVTASIVQLGRSVVQSAGSLAAERGLVFRSTISESVPDVKADAIGVLTVLGVVVDNALKFTAPGVGGRVELEIFEVSPLAAQREAPQF